MDTNHTCLAATSLDSAHKQNDSYYLQVFLKEFKCIDKKVVRYISDRLSLSSASSN